MFILVDEEVRKWCPRCHATVDRSPEPMYCMQCGTAMLDRFCIPCGEPLLGPELLHFSSYVSGGPKVL